VGCLIGIEVRDSQLYGYSDMDHPSDPGTAFFFAGLLISTLPMALDNTIASRRSRKGRIACQLGDFP
jgi:hypothetical protein